MYIKEHWTSFTTYSKMDEILSIIWINKAKGIKSIYDSLHKYTKIGNKDTFQNTYKLAKTIYKKSRNIYFSITIKIVLYPAGRKEIINCSHKDHLKCWQYFTLFNLGMHYARIFQNTYWTAYSLCKMMIHEDFIWKFKML